MALGSLRQRVGPWPARLLSIWTLLILLGYAGPAFAVGPASPLLQDVAAVITSPQSGESVRGTVQVIGSALHPAFQRYELYYTVEPGENWVFIGEARTTPVSGGLLGTWETGGLPDGNYSLRLRVVRQDGNYDEGYARNIVVANTTPPTPTPTPTLPVDATLPPPIDSVVTPTPAATPTPAVVEQPEIPTPTPRPSPTVTPQQEEQLAANDSASSGDSGSSGSLTDVLETSALQSSFVRGASITAAIFLAVGAFFGMRRLLMWLWYLIAP